MQRYCPVCHKLIDMRRLSEATRPSDVADPWHFERHTREDYSGGTRDTASLPRFWQERARCSGLLVGVVASQETAWCWACGNSIALVTPNPKLRLR